MHELEPGGYCTIEEYRRFLEQRKQAADITIKGLYLVIADIRVEGAKMEAFKFPIRVESMKADREHALIIANFLNLDLQPKSRLYFAMVDGIAIRPRICEKNTKQSVQELYIRDYKDFVPLGPGEANIEDEIYSREPVIA